MLDYYLNLSIRLQVWHHLVEAFINLFVIEFTIARADVIYLIFIFEQHQLDSINIGVPFIILNLYCHHLLLVFSYFILELQLHHLFS
jgi:hypothetical protein